MKCDVDGMNPDWLYHVTNKSNIPSILEHGLSPDLSEFTIEAIFLKRTNDMGMDWDDPEGMCMDEEELENEKEALYEEIREETSEMVFATTFDDLPIILNVMIHNLISPISPKEIAVIAIKGRCKAFFEEKEIASPVDWVSTRRVPPSCLEVIDEKHYKHMMERRPNYL